MHLEKVCHMQIGNESNCFEIMITRVNFHVVKLSCIIVDNRVNLGSVDLDKKSVISLADVSLVDFNTVLVVQLDRFCFYETIVEVTVDCTCKK